MEQIQQLMRVHASELKTSRGEKESKESEASKERRKAQEKVYFVLRLVETKCLFELKIGFIFVVSF